MEYKGINYLFKLIAFIAIQCVATPLLAQDFDFPEDEKSADTVRLDTLIFESFNIKDNLRQQLIPLDSIIRIAMSNHPQVKFQGALVDKSKHNLSHVRRLWSNNIYGYGNYTWGDQTILLNTNNQGAAENTNFTTGYQTGIGFRIPVYEFYGRQARINQAKAELKASEHQKEVFEQTIEMQVIQEYFNL